MGAVIGHPEGAVSSGMVLLYVAFAKGRDRREDNSSPGDYARRGLEFVPCLSDES